MNIPPQAYTRDTLVKAIAWIHNQPPALRERAKSADLVVSYYLQACRQASAQQMETPVSGEAFKSDLRHLAEDLKQFEDPAPSPPQHQLPPLREVIREAPAPAPAPAPVQPPHSVAAPVYTHREPPLRSFSQGFTWQVDARSLAYARELQQRFNFSSEAEALRMLLTLGSERMREMLP